MKKVCLDLTESRALGDTLCSTPTIRKLLQFNHFIFFNTISIV